MPTMKEKSRQPLFRIILTGIPLTCGLTHCGWSDKTGLGKNKPEARCYIDRNNENQIDC